MKVPKNVCRLCLGDTGIQLDLYKQHGEGQKSYASEIRHCLSLELREEDGLSQVICIKCVGQLEECSVYFNKVLDLHGKLIDESTIGTICYYCHSVRNHLFPIHQASQDQTAACFNFKVPKKCKICHRCQFHLETLYELKQKAKSAAPKLASGTFVAQKGDESVEDIIDKLQNNFRLGTRMPPMKKRKWNEREPRIQVMDIVAYMGQSFFSRGPVSAFEFLQEMPSSPLQKRVRFGESSEEQSKVIVTRRSILKNENSGNNSKQHTFTEEVKVSLKQTRSTCATPDKKSHCTSSLKGGSDSEEDVPLSKLHPIIANSDRKVLRIGPKSKQGKLQNVEERTSVLSQLKKPKRKQKDLPSPNKRRKNVRRVSYADPENVYADDLEHSFSSEVKESISDSDFGESAKMSRSTVKSGKKYNPPEYQKALDKVLACTPKSTFKPYICPICHEGYVSTVKGMLHKLMVHDPRSNFTLQLSHVEKYVKEDVLKRVPQDDVGGLSSEESTEIDSSAAVSASDSVDNSEGTRQSGIPGAICKIEADVDSNIVDSTNVDNVADDCPTVNSTSFDSATVESTTIDCAAIDSTSNQEPGSRQGASDVEGKVNSLVAKQIDEEMSAEGVQMDSSIQEELNEEGSNSLSLNEPSEENKNTKLDETGSANKPQNNNEESEDGNKSPSSDELCEEKENTKSDGTGSAIEPQNNIEKSKDGNKSPSSDELCEEKENTKSDGTGSTNKLQNNSEESEDGNKSPSSDELCEEKENTKSDGTGSANKPQNNNEESEDGNKSPSSDELCEEKENTKSDGTGSANKPQNNIEESEDGNKSLTCDEQKEEENKITNLDGTGSANEPQNNIEESENEEREPLKVTDKSACNKDATVLEAEQNAVVEILKTDEINSENSEYPEGVTKEHDSGEICSESHSEPENDHEEEDQKEHVDRNCDLENSVDNINAISKEDQSIQLPSAHANGTEAINGDNISEEP